MLFKLCGLVVLGMLALGGMVTHLVAGPDDWWWTSRMEVRERMQEAHERALEAREQARERIWEARQRVRDRVREAQQRREMFREEARRRREAQLHEQVDPRLAVESRGVHQHPVEVEDDGFQLHARSVGSHGMTWYSPAERSGRGEVVGHRY